MTAIEFVQWLKYWLELGDLKQLSEEEVNIIKDNIEVVLANETKKPVATSSDAAAKRAEEMRKALQELINSGKHMTTSAHKKIEVGMGMPKPLPDLEADFISKMYKKF